MVIPTILKFMDYYEKFPCVRPVDKALLVLVDGIEKEGKVVNTSSGVGIEVDKVVFDSNYIIWWKYK